MTVGRLKEKLNKYSDGVIVRITDPGSLVVIPVDGDCKILLSFGDNEDD